MDCKELGKHEDFEYQWNKDGYVTFWNHIMGRESKIIDPNHIQMLVEKELLEPKPIGTKSNLLEHASSILNRSYLEIAQQYELLFSSEIQNKADRVDLNEYVKSLRG